VIPALSNASAGVKLLMLGTVVVFLLGAGFAGGLKWQSGVVADLKLQHSETLRGIAQQTARVAELSRQASEKFREREQRQAQRFVEIATTSYQKGKNDAQAAANAVVADLHAGNRQLRQQWAGCLSATRGSAEAAAGVGRADAEAELRRADVGRVLAIAGACDAHVEALHATLSAERDGQ